MFFTDTTLQEVSKLRIHQQQQQQHAPVSGEISDDFDYLLNFWATICKAVRTALCYRTVV